MKGEKVDWNELPLQRWLGSITKKTTKAAYKSGYRFYNQYTKQTATQLIDEALEDAKKDPRQKTDIVKQRLIGFYNWLVNEAPKRRAVGKGKTKQVAKGVSSKMAHTYVNAVRSFYGTYDVYVKLRGRSRLPEPRVRNKRIIVSNQDVKRLVDNARSPRNRAAILVMFQGGMDVSTLCDLTYGDVAEHLAANEHPLKLELFRKKAGVEYYTFLGKDATDALKAYINDVEARGLTFNSKGPLFLKEGHKAKQGEGLEPRHVQAVLREVAMKSGFVNKKLNGKDFNPLGPHALRESFGSIMINKGVPDTVVDFWLGHKIGEMAEAYKSGQFEDLKRMYLEREAFISISKPGLDEKGLEEKVEAKVDLQVQGLRKLITTLSTENLELRNRMAKTELALTESRKEIGEIKEILKKMVED